MGQPRHAGFVRRVKTAARLNGHRHIQHRDVVIFHEQHLRTAGALPVLDVGRGGNRNG